MLGGVSQKTTTDANGAVVNPKGTLYMTFNSASGSKYYEMQSPDLNGTYEAVKQQIHVPTISLMSVTSNNLTISTYRTDTMAQTDTYTIAKAPTTNYDAMANGTVLIGTKTFALDYANDPLNAKEITNAVLGGGAIYFKDFSGNWIDNLTGLASMPK